jgi:hypothetical protein
MSTKAEIAAIHSTFITPPAEVLRHLSRDLDREALPHNEESSIIPIRQAE